MAGKKVFMLRVSPEMYEAVEKWAADEFRSVNGQLEWVIEKALRSAGRSPAKSKTQPPGPGTKNTEL
ncbi:MAG TPA: DNA-binding protein [Bacteroidales bacterium]|nr:DNA-binding protein [Bacteroidales bacterium]HPS61574.1 DNA-binding protein [Bacteroidales bacterium]